MQHALGLSAIALVLASTACGSQTPSAHTNEYVTELALTQVEADLGPGAVVVRPIDQAEDDEDESCTLNGHFFSSCVVSLEQPLELHVQTTLCEIKPDQPARTRFFVECRPEGPEIVRPAEIPHCPGHG